ncbi:L-serine ammonia-lyase, iron-sulfur-dependent, subunit alpha [Candidatus Bipolaricaulota bacterium]|nr:L-serine ammonia-lyase, iron-sulfur-dependent, subunit alpha [Candidatus Bipolaricaulota bacterium]
MFSLKAFLHHEVKPALGCTEPGAVALAVARAAQELPHNEEISFVRVTVSEGIYKNGVAVGIPGVKGAKATCSLKAGTTALEAYLVALFALKGQNVSNEGIVGASIEETIDNVAHISQQGMKDVDKVVLEVLQQRARENYT